MNIYMYIVCHLKGHKWAPFPVIEVLAEHPYPENVAFVRRCQRCGTTMTIHEH